MWRAADEALRQARSENVLAARTEQEEAVVAAEELFQGDRRAEGRGRRRADEEEPAEA